MFGGMRISNLRFAEDIDLIAGSSNELQKVTESLIKSALDRHAYAI